MLRCGECTSDVHLRQKENITSHAGGAAAAVASSPDGCIYTKQKMSSHAIRGITTSVPAGGWSSWQPVCPTDGLMMIIHDTGRPQGASRAYESHADSFWRDLTSCVLRGGATLKAGRVSFDWAEQKFRNPENWIFCCETFTIFVPFWKTTDCVEQTGCERIFIWEPNTSCPGTKVETR